MGRGEEDLQLKAAKRGYREASADGNREEEARFANVIGDMYKKRGEYVEAIRWLQIDYKISTKFLPQKQILPTCQSLGEVYFLLGRFQDALVYQVRVTNHLLVYIEHFSLRSYFLRAKPERFELGIYCC